jgi:hypothetical protein
MVSYDDYEMDWIASGLAWGLDGCAGGLGMSAFLTLGQFGL